jgi:hypothetical protein
VDRKVEVLPEQLLLPFDGLLDGAHRVCDRYAIGMSRIRGSALPDRYQKAYAASLSNSGRKLLEKQDSGTRRVAPRTSEVRNGMATGPKRLTCNPAPPAKSKPNQ